MEDHTRLSSEGNNNVVSDILKKTGIEIDNVEVKKKTIVSSGRKKKSKDLSLVLKINGETEHSLGLTPILLGRDEGCSIQLQSPEVSRNHAIIYKYGKFFALRDLDSTNGTLINNQYVNFSTIKPGDQICIGEDVVDVLQGQEVVEPYKTQCSIVFVDIANYTSLCEKFGQEFSDYVRVLLDDLEIDVLLRQGCPLQNLGDGLMFTFGIWPMRKQQYSKKSSMYLMTLNFIKYIFHFIKDYQHYGPLGLRVGVAAGEVNIHQREGQGLHVIGDTVNLASRLESANKQYGTRVLVNDEFVDRLGQQLHYQCRKIDHVRLKGKKLPTTIYTLNSIDANTQSLGYDSQFTIVQKLYSAGLKLFQQGKFEAALDCFNKAARSNDYPSINMSKRVKHILANPDLKALQEWDGLWDLDK